MAYVARFLQSTKVYSVTSQVLFDYTLLWSFTLVLHATSQALSLLLAIILRSMVSTRKTEYDTNEEIGDQDRIRETLLNPPANQASGAKFALWGARMREKVSH